MKKLVLVALVLSSFAATKAQVANTTWKGAIKGESAQPAVFKFKKDTVVLFAADGSVIETMKYALKQGIITLTKISGQSDCGNGPGSYKLTVAKGSMVFSTSKDDCSDRSSALDGTKWVKEK